MKKLTLAEYLTRLFHYVDKAKDRGVTIFVPEANVYDLACLATKFETGCDTLDLHFAEQMLDVGFKVDYDTNSEDYEFSVCQMIMPNRSIIINPNLKRDTTLPECRIDDRNSSKLCDSIEKLNMHIVPLQKLSERESELMIKMVGLKRSIERKHYEKYYNIFNG